MVDVLRKAREVGGLLPAGWRLEVLWSPRLSRDVGWVVREEGEAATLPLATLQRRDLWPPGEAGQAGSVGEVIAQVEEAPQSVGVGSEAGARRQVVNQPMREARQETRGALATVTRRQVEEFREEGMEVADKQVQEVREVAATQDTREATSQQMSEEKEEATALATAPQAKRSKKRASGALAMVREVSVDLEDVARSGRVGSSLGRPPTSPPTLPPPQESTKFACSKCKNTYKSRKSLSDHVSRKHPSPVLYSLPLEHVQKAHTKPVGKSKTMATSSARRARSRSAFRPMARPARSLPSALPKPRVKKADTTSEQAISSPIEHKKRKISKTAEKGEGSSTKRGEVDVKSEAEEEAPKVSIIMKWKEKQFKVEVSPHSTMGKVMKRMKRMQQPGDVVFLFNKARVGEEEEVARFVGEDKQVEMVEERKE